MKLSELSNDTVLGLDDFDIPIFTKEEYLINREYYNGAVYLAEPKQVYFKLADAIENSIEDEVYEDCVQDVMYDLDNRETMNTKEIEKIINDAIQNNPTYDRGQEIEIDM